MRIIKKIVLVKKNKQVVLSQSADDEEDREGWECDCEDREAESVYMCWCEEGVLGEGGECRWSSLSAVVTVSTLAVCGGNDSWNIKCKLGHLYQGYK